MKKEEIKKKLQMLRNKQAWKIVSGEMNLTPKLIEKYEDEIDWDELSNNSEICWTPELASKYQKRINWESLSTRLFDSKEKLAWMEHLKIVRNFTLVLDWDALSNSYLPTREEYLKEFAEHWNWEEIAENYDIVWSDSLFLDFEDKLLSVLSTLALDRWGDEPDIRKSKRGYRYNDFPVFFEQLFKKDADKLKIKLLNQLFCDDDGDQIRDRRTQVTISDLSTKQIF